MINFVKGKNEIKVKMTYAAEDDRYVMAYYGKNGTINVRRSQSFLLD